MRKRDSRLLKRGKRSQEEGTVEVVPGELTRNRGYGRKRIIQLRKKIQPQRRRGKGGIC